MFPFITQQKWLSNTREKLFKKVNRFFHDPVLSSLDYYPQLEENYDCTLQQHPGKGSNSRKQKINLHLENSKVRNNTNIHQIKKKHEIATKHPMIKMCESTS